MIESVKLATELLPLLKFALGLTVAINIYPVGYQIWLCYALVNMVICYAMISKCIPQVYFRQINHVQYLNASTSQQILVQDSFYRFYIFSLKNQVRPYCFFS